MKKKIQKTISMFLAVCTVLVSFSLSNFAFADTVNEEDLRLTPHRYSYALENSNDADSFYFWYFMFGDFGDEIEIVENKVDSIYEELDLNSKDYIHKLLAIYNWLGLNVNYDKSVLNDANKHSVFYSLFIDHKGVCSDFSAAFQFLCRNAGITDVTSVTGGNHSWNIVKYGNYWYIVDASNGAFLDTTYFMYIMSDTDTLYNPDAYYTTAKFKAAHPMATSSLDLKSLGISPQKTLNVSYNESAVVTCGSNNANITFTLPQKVTRVYIMEYPYIDTGNNFGSTIGLSCDFDGNIFTTGDVRQFYKPQDGTKTMSINLIVAKMMGYKLVGIDNEYNRYISNLITVEPKPNEKHEYVEASRSTLSCTTDESITYVCTKCNDKKVDVLQKATGHTASHISVTKASFTEDGKREYTCTKCKEAVTETIPKISRIVPSKTEGFYNGKPHSVNVTLFDSKNAAVSKDNYTLLFPKDMTSVGKHTYQVILSGDEYEGTQELTYNIYGVLKSAKVSDLTYTADALAVPKITVYDSLGKAVSSQYYTVTTPNSYQKIGSYKLTVLGDGFHYQGTFKADFKVLPSKTALKTLKANKKGFTVKWKKKTKDAATGYQIQYSTKSKFKSAKTVTVKGYKTTNKAVKKLKSKKKYYVRIRTYKTVKGIKYYSAWSAKKSVKTK